MGILAAAFNRHSLKHDDGQHLDGGRGSQPRPPAPSVPPPQEALLQLLPVLTSLDGGWWEQVERAVVATAQHLSASHACVFIISSDSAYASPLALAGPPAPPLCIGTPMPMLVGGTGAHHTTNAAMSSAMGSAQATEEGGLPAAAMVGPAAGPSCAAAALVAEQLDKDPGRLLMFADSHPAGRSGAAALPASAPPEWRHLAAASGCRHFAAVAIPSGHQPMGVLSMAAEGPSRPASWTPEALHCSAAMLSAPIRVPQVDLACRALAELSAAATVHQLVRIILGAAAELVVTVTRIETQARVAFLQPDVEAAAVFQSAATDVLGPAVRRRLSEVLLVETTAGPAGAGALGRVGSVAPLPTRRSLGGNETVASRSPSIAAAGTVMSGDSHRDSFLGSRAVHGAEELPVCRGHSLPLKHTLLSEALAQGTGLCIADCNAYVQDSKVYPRDLAVSRGGGPAQSLALATSCHGGKPLLALYATYHSILPQALLQTVVQELGQLLRALTPSVAAQVEGPLAVEWGYLRHQLLESMRNRSLRSLHHNNLSNSHGGASAAEAAAALGCDSPGAGTPSLAPPPPLAYAAALNAAAQRAALDGPLTDTLPPAPGTAAQSTVAASTGGLAQLQLGLGIHLEPGCASGSAGLLGSERSRANTGTRDGRASGGRASFSLEAATSPRGSCKLAPLMATLHERLKAAQAEQMANCRAASRMQDLESIRILEQIGRGGYGVVYRGLYHGSEVAIKVIQEAEVAAANGSGSQGGPLRRMNSVALENKHLHDAIELVASVGMGGHPNIVQVLTFFTDAQVVVGDQPVDTLNRRLSGLDGVAELLHLTRMPSTLESPPHGGDKEHVPRGSGVIVLVQEFCDAGTLKNAITQRAFYRGPSAVDVNIDRTSRGHLQLNLRSVYSTLLEIALALRHMHGLHMVHCDLKPQNVLLKSSPRDPRGFTAKLSDFGLAKMMAHDDEGQLVIDEAVGSGTLTHMAPESLTGQKQLTASIDMFAFGILMWQLVCGTRLYQGLNTKQIIRGVVREKLRPVFPVWVPAEYRRLAERCWHPVPADRPTASTVVSELEIMVDQHSRTSWRSWRGLQGGTGSEQQGTPRHHPHPHPQQLQPPQAVQQAAQQLLGGAASGHGAVSDHPQQHVPTSHQRHPLGRAPGPGGGGGPGPSRLII